MHINSGPDNTDVPELNSSATLRESACVFCHETYEIKHFFKMTQRSVKFLFFRALLERDNTIPKLNNVPVFLFFQLKQNFAIQDAASRYETRYVMKM